MWLPLCLVLGMFTTVAADIYLHNPRGSNNRLNEQTSARNNANRLFDSQNNNKGGYNVGEVGERASGNDPNQQYQMKYFQSSASAPSELVIEWTMQHGCGGGTDARQRAELNCDVILQYMCQGNQDLSGDQIRDGVSTNRADHTILTGQETKEESDIRKSNDIKLDRGLHESWEWYDKCSLLKRNQGLFRADVNLQGDTARFTRQNPNGNRNGYECPSERDYYPYWAPTPWKDIAILTTNDTLCRRRLNVYESFTVTPRYECIEMYPDSQERKHWSTHNNKQDCEANGGRWTAFYNYLEKLSEHKTREACMQSRGRQDRTQRMWAVPYDSVTLQAECLVTLPPPICQRAPWTRANHLGNTVDAVPTTFKWTIPYFPSETTKRCVLRARYNITSTDELSLIRNQPRVQPIDGIDQTQVLQINPQQFGRTFQDRSHAFLLVPRPQSLQHQTIHNLNVRGKRGNIVQAFPAVEYDFVPQQIFIRDADLLHIQWTGSNVHFNRPDGADGVGRAGTDRTNIVQMNEFGKNYPMLWNDTTLFKRAQIRWTYFNTTQISPESLALNLLTSGFYRCKTTNECPDNTPNQYIYERNPRRVNPTLDNAPASYEGVVIQLPADTYHIMSTRSNQFSNRSQKKTINVCQNYCRGTQG